MNLSVPFAFLVASVSICGCAADPPIHVEEPGKGGGTLERCGEGIYPCGPYGTVIGTQIRDLTFVGRRDVNRDGDVTNDPSTKIRLSQYFQDKTIKVLVVLASAEWCPPCKAEQPELVALWKKYQQEKTPVAFLETVIQDVTGKPAQIDVVDRWAKAYGIPFDMVADPTAVLGPYYDTAAFPMEMVITTADMKIQAQWNGYQKGLVDSWVTTLLSE